MRATTYPVSEYLPLNKTVLCFYPQQDGLDCAHVGQVTVETTTKDPTVPELVAYHNAQDDISKAIQRLFVGQKFCMLPEKIILDGDGYKLTGTRKLWDYGKNTLDLRWGGDEIKQFAYKWSFLFTVQDKETQQLHILYVCD
ncbi:uncharacterized protein BT62DRAFT_662304 [Guyanagaster necrorhizus]|uniref:Uncharacterized protein n=1 Tax=Guyanagaster necrorhizus TaxID=856835 RepID=A0A9P7W0G7_9AGAR|nr:uncharacterized protein BT62DRAFT_662304 [Guyanagaster necrorhizus MCA 3950]KAG7449096.1 hypothetical protein BT62DRAFT_662304 [Guyanagaster necrorhizus MCA 3950]